MKQNANQEKFELDIATIDLPLQVYEFSGEEKLGEDYYFDITFICEDPDVDLAAWLQLPARLSLHHNNDKTPRYVHGIIEFIEQLATSFRYSTYKLKLTPIFNLLSYRTHFRIFQKQTIPDIITAVYQDAGIQNNHFSMELFSPHLSREYCVQYGETDHAFIKRLMAEEGLVSFFEHLEVNSTLIISDGSEVYTELPPLRVVSESGMAKERDTIMSLVKKQKVNTGKVSIRDYVFERPKYSLSETVDHINGTDETSESPLEQYSYQPIHAFSLDDRKHAIKEQIKLKLDQQRSTSLELIGISDSAQLRVGYFQPIQSYTNESWNSTWLLITVKHEGKQPQVLEELADGVSNYKAEFTCIPWMTSFKLTAQAKPRIKNIDTAIVTGPKNEEIYCDEFGRVKVQFHWDRNGQGNETTSCWVRTSQGWAGNQYGQFVLPRVGHEVLVTFLQGDPDKPLITGSLYNGDNKPPYALPEHKTRSTFKTSSSIGGDNFNELRFEDKKDNEHIYIHAAKDLDIQIKNNQTTEVFKDDHKVIHQNQFVEIKKDRHRTVNGDQFTSIKKDTHQQILGSEYGKVREKKLIDIGSELHIDVGNKIILEAGTEFTISAGGSTLKVDPAGVHLFGAAINLNAGGSAGSGSGYAGITATQPVMKQNEMAGSVAETATTSEQTRSKIDTAHQIEAFKTSDPVCEECEQEQGQE